MNSKEYTSMARDEESTAIYLAIRESHERASLAIEMIKVHQAECAGRQKVIDLQLKVIIWILGAMATSGFAVASALATKWGVG